MPVHDLDTADAIWGVVLAVHLVCWATWIGGIAYALFVLRPSLGLLDATPRMSVQMQTLNRFFRLVWMVMPTVLVTGWAMTIGKEGGFAHAPWFVNAMQGLALLMVAVFLWIYFGPFRRLRRAIRPQPQTFEAVRSLLTTSLALGAATILVASLGHFIQ